MFLTLVPFFRLMLVPAVGTEGHGSAPVPSDMCTVPSGQNSRVAVVPNDTPVERKPTGPSSFGRVSGSASVAGYGYTAGSHRFAAVSAASGADGVPINSVMRYSFTA